MRQPPLIIATGDANEIRTSWFRHSKHYSRLFSSSESEDSLFDFFLFGCAGGRHLGQRRLLRHDAGRQALEKGGQGVHHSIFLEFRRVFLVISRCNGPHCVDEVIRELSATSFMSHEINFPVSSLVLTACATPSPERIRYIAA